MSATQKRRVVCYPSPKYDILFSAYVKVNEESRSKAAAHAIKCLIDNLPPDKKMQVINAAKELNVKNPSKNSY